MLTHPKPRAHQGTLGMLLLVRVQLGTIPTMVLEALA